MMRLRPIGPGRDKVARAIFHRQVKAFQMDNFLHQDGIVGEQTFWFMIDTIHHLKVKLAACRQPDDPGPESLPQSGTFKPAQFGAGFFIGAVVVLLVAGALH